MVRPAQLLAAASLLVLKASASSADPISASVLTAAYEPPALFNALSFVGGGYQKAQTFTVTTGGLLTRVEVFVDSGFLDSTPLFVDITPVSNGLPVEDDTLRLARGIIPDTLVTPAMGFTPVEFGPNAFAVQPGTELALVLTTFRPSVDFGYGWVAQFADPSPYPAGGHFFRVLNPATPGLPTTWTAIPDVDAGFRAFVIPDVQPIPEPSTLILLGIGVAALPGHRKRRLMQNADPSRH